MPKPWGRMRGLSLKLVLGGPDVVRLRSYGADKCALLRTETYGQDLSWTSDYFLFDDVVDLFL